MHESASLKRELDVPEWSSVPSQSAMLGSSA